MTSTNVQLMQEGVNLMLSGMGFVLVFLLILIFAIKLMSKLIGYFSSEPTLPQQAFIPTTELNDLERLRPVIVAAIAHHRRQQNLQ
ncbi:oxaloacetate decarboxylase subunit gamma [Histophilus somni]|uniref:oxaloacetate decarboxylase subunit gamma n=1 Tax=Histophilus somni TaxID=731 RepID=UPI00201F0714|nr:oxaloacetate decarboxylase subunit gamma [Histophilus somni]